MTFHTDADGHPIADRLRKEEAQQPDQDVEFSGTVETIGSDQWVISGRTVLVNASTVIEGSPAVGDTVEVHATTSALGLTATRIQAEDRHSPNPPEPHHVGFEGAVQATGAIWMISGER